MALGIGNLGNIVEDFTNSISQILGGAPTSGVNEAIKGGPEGQLFNSKVGGSVKLEKDKWIGNAGSQKRKVRYGFATFTLDQIQNGGGEINGGDALGTYYLDIPPRSINQKEIFANNIQATRKGVIVESEGVVFRDIVIRGTTGIFPGPRGSANNPLPNADFTAPPQTPKGVDPQTGRSTASNVKNISGYEEFLRLRQFFLLYAQRKVESDGNLFLIFINEKDNQNLIVEPIDFTMSRDAKSPMTYDYEIKLKGIGDLNILFQSADASNTGQSGFLGFLEDVGNVSANIQASISTGRAVLNQSVRLLSRISESVDQTINGPLRQLQFATQDLSDGLTTVLSLPEVLSRNATNAALNIRENLDEIGSTVNSALGNRGGLSAATGAGISRVESSSERVNAAATFSQQRDIIDRIQNDSRVAVQRSFMQNVKNDMQDISNNLADFVGLGDPTYDAIKGRISTITPDPLKVVSDEEFILLGQLQKITSSLDTGLATNLMFQSDAEESFKNASAQFNNDDIPANQRVNIKAPTSVREITILRGDTLERIAQREYNDALRWIDIVVLNNLKPPYLSEEGGDGVRKPGERLLIGVGNG